MDKDKKHEDLNPDETISHDATLNNQPPLSPPTSTIHGLSTIGNTADPNPTLEVSDGTISNARTLNRSSSVSEYQSAEGSERSSSGYSLLEEIGQGGMGVVYRTRQESLSREIAIKTLHTHVTDDFSRQKFLEEAMVTSYLDHPNIVPVHDLGRTLDDRLLLAMKLVGGKSWKDLLKEQIEQTPEDPQEAIEHKESALLRNLNILDAVANAIAFAHDRGLAHLDLKPENIMVGDYGEVLVMDWGIAVDIRPKEKRTENQRAPGHESIQTPCGTPSYMAPELADGRGEDVSKQTDVYLLGAILFQLLTGSPPHRGPSVPRILIAASEGQEPKLPADTPEELARACKKAMAKDHKQRFESVREISDAVANYRQHRESMKLTAEAQKKLDRGNELSPKEGDEISPKDREALYESFNDAVYGFRQASSLWNGNTQAKQGEFESIESFATIALILGDLNLASTQVAKLPEQRGQELRLGVQKAVEKKDAEVKFRKMLIGAVAVSLLAVLVSLSGGLYFVRKKNKAIAKEKNEVEVQKKKVEDEKKIVEEQNNTIKAQNTELKGKNNLINKQNKELASNNTTITSQNEDLKEKNATINQQNDDLAKLLKSEKKAKNDALEAQRKSEERLSKLFEERGRQELLDGQYLKAITFLEAAYQGDRKPVKRSTLRFLRRQAFRPIESLVASLDAHTAAVTVLAVNQSGSRLLTGQQSGTIVLWDSNSGEQLHRVQPFVSNRLKRLEFSSDGKKYLVVSDRFLYVFETKSGKRLVRYDLHFREGCLGAHFSADSRSVISVGRAIQIWSAETGFLTQEFGAPPKDKRYRSWALGPNKEKIAVRVERDVIQVWNLKTQKIERSFEAPNSFFGQPVFSPTGQYLLVAGNRRSIQVWDVKSEKKIKTLKKVDHQGLFALNPKSSRLVSPDFSGIKLYDFPSGQLVKEIKAHSNVIKSLVIDPTGEVFATASDDMTVKLWSSRDGRFLKSLRTHLDSVNSLQFHPKEAVLFSGSEDRRANIVQWKKARDPILTSFNTPRGVGMRPRPPNARLTSDGRFLTTSRLIPDDNQAMGERSVFDPKTGSLLFSFQSAIFGESLHEIANDVPFAYDSKRQHFAFCNKNIDLEIFDKQGKRVHTIVMPKFVNTLTKTKSLYKDRIVALFYNESDQFIVQFSAFKIVAYNAGTFKEEARFQSLWSGESIVALNSSASVVLTTSSKGQQLRFGPKFQKPIKIEGPLKLIGKALFSSDSQRLLIRDEGLQSAIWNAKTGKRLCLLLNTGRWYSARFSPDHKRLLLLGGKYNLSLWNSESGTLIKDYGNTRGYINALTMSSDSQFFAMTTTDGKARVWNLADGSLQSVLERPADKSLKINSSLGADDALISVDFHPSSEFVLTGENSGFARIWDPREGNLLESIPMRQPTVAKFLDSRRFVLTTASGNGQIREFSFDQEISENLGALLRSRVPYILDESGRLVGKNEARSLRETPTKKGENAKTRPQYSKAALKLYKQGVTASLAGQTKLAIAALSEARAAGLEENDVSLLLGLNQLKQKDEVQSLTYHWSLVRFSEFIDDRHFISGSHDETAALWDSDTGQKLRTFRGHEGNLVAGAKLDKDRFVTASSDGRAIVWQISTGKKLKDLETRKSALTSLALSPDKKILVLGGVDGQARVFNSQTGLSTKTLKLARGVSFLKFRPDGRQLIACQGDTAVIYSATTLNRSLSLSMNRRVIRDIDCSPNSQLLAVASQSNDVAVWNLHSGKKVYDLPGHRGGGRVVVFSPNGTLLASSDRSGALNIWRLKDGQRIRRSIINREGLSAMIFSKDSRSLYLGTADGKVVHYDIEKALLISTWSGYSRGVWNLSFTPHPSKLLIQSFGGTLYLQPCQQQSQRLLPGSIGSDDIADISPNGERIVCSALSGPINVVSVSSGQVLKQFPGSSSNIRSLKISSDGKTLACVHDDQRLRIYDLEKLKLKKSIPIKETISGLEISKSNQSVVAMTAGALYFFDLDGESIRVVRGQKGARFSRLASSGRFIAAKVRISYNDSIEFYDERTGTRVTTIIEDEASLDPNGEYYAYLISERDLKSVRLCVESLRSRKQKRSSQALSLGSYRGIPTVGPNGNFIAVRTYSDIFIHNTKSEILSVAALKERNTLKSSFTGEMRFDPKGAFIAASTYQETALWSIWSGAMIYRIPKERSYDTVKILDIADSGLAYIRNSRNGLIYHSWPRDNGPPKDIEELRKKLGYHMKDGLVVFSKNEIEDRRPRKLNHPRLYVKRANGYAARLGQRKPNKAERKRILEDFEAALKLDGTFVEVYLSRGATYVRWNELELGLKDLKVFLKLAPKSHPKYRVVKDAIPKIEAFQRENNK